MIGSEMPFRLNLKCIDTPAFDAYRDQFPRIDLLSHHIIVTGVQGSRGDFDDFPESLPILSSSRGAEI